MWNKDQTAEFCRKTEGIADKIDFLSNGYIKTGVSFTNGDISRLIAERCWNLRFDLFQTMAQFAIFLDDAATQVAELNGKPATVDNLRKLTQAARDTLYTCRRQADVVESDEPYTARCKAAARRFAQCRYDILQAFRTWTTVLGHCQALIAELEAKHEAQQPAAVAG
jgi:hypothetical protein